MRGNYRRDTRPERALREALSAFGLHGRIDHPVAVGSRTIRPDIVFARQRLAVFLDGCFWHGCRYHGTAPRANRSYWASKLDRNRRRDRATNATLARHGWGAVRVWEHESPDRAAHRIAEAVHGRKPAPKKPL